MGDFIKASTDPKNILAALFVLGSTTIGGPLGFLASSAAVASASAAIKGAGAQQVELDLAARQEGLAAKDREVARKRRLVAVLGSQRAAAAAAGVALSGSVANISIADAEQASIDRLLDRTNTRITLDRIGRQRQSIGRAGVLSAGGTILSSAAVIAQGVTLNKPRKQSAAKTSKSSSGRGR